MTHSLIHLELTKQVMGVETIMIPRATHGFAEDQMPLFTPESVSAAMGLIFGE